mmetsp:Transcript_15435/g.49408  ORF Transcript_15435/g.49408 Transcript_15435/m.49408 type:complete len:204 (+) Transcript_15435:301-912(+)
MRAGAPPAGQALPQNLAGLSRLAGRGLRRPHPRHSGHGAGAGAPALPPRQWPLDEPLHGGLPEHRRGYGDLRGRAAPVLRAQLLGPLVAARARSPGCQPRGENSGRSFPAGPAGGEPQGWCLYPVAQRADSSGRSAPAVLLHEVPAASGRRRLVRDPACRGAGAGGMDRHHRLLWRRLCALRRRGRARHAAAKRWRAALRSAL